VLARDTALAPRMASTLGLLAAHDERESDNRVGPTRPHRFDTVSATRGQDVPASAAIATRSHEEACILGL